ncbi:atp-dependent rna helicase mitochondrial [Limosa lapponica baueri]|uniref:ATP-dependent RNA helicase SUPV3L1, mitochondrial n=1 Tax=Limosa lapponica baueri TaxID=1758121 RepID=A0A2I0TS98_LIMLA|nr:atp-dependent rna helicase mitochondrial [Limosa lapponica baueri]
MYSVQLQSFLGGFFAPPCEIDVILNDAETRKTAEIKTEDGKVEKHFLFYDGESVSGKVNVSFRQPGKRQEHQGIRIEFVGQIELFNDKSNTHEFVNLVKELALPGELTQSRSYDFEFMQVEKPYESYIGANVRLRYFLKVTIVRRLSDLVKEYDLIVHQLATYPDVNNSIKMEVGIEDCLHIEFEYNKSKYHLKDVIVGKIYFLLVRIKIQHMELQLIKKEITGIGPSTTTETETIAKYEIMDGAPVKGRIVTLDVEGCSGPNVMLPWIVTNVLALTFSSGHVDDLFPFFLRHAKQIFPMLDCMDDLRKISDLRLPPNWYPDARAIQRKIIFHAGPTNSGKTYHAIQRFLSAKSGIYCGPLKLLAHEIFQKSNDANVPCDLVTGEERVYANEDARQAPHIACTIEMCSTNTPYEVAVIDEIQMIRDPARGWAWTRALLGLCAEEIHVCGEAAAIDLVTELMYTTGEEVEVRNYKRLTPLTVLDYALESLDNLQPGDCIVCFSKNDIYSVSRQVEARGLECAVIYGSLPPGTKLEQAKKFNDPDDPCKILVATDAIGMGLNLCIKRIIFNSIVKPTINEKGEKEIDSITTSQALQIAGRAGRYGSSFKQGEVTTMHRDDLMQLKEILSEPVRPVKAAGLHPTPEQIEMFAYHLPDATLSNLIDIFVSLSQVDGLYFVCNIDDFKFLADMIQHIPLNLRSRYVFCTAPLNRKEPFVCTTLLKFARQFSRNEPLTFDWLCRHTKWPLAAPKNIKELVHLEAVHDVFDLYLWLSYRFMDMFPDAVLVRDIQKKLDDIIQVGVCNITKLIRASQSAAAPGTAAVVSEDFPLSRTKRDTRAVSDRHGAKSTEALSIAAEVPGERRGKNLKTYRSAPRQEDLKSHGRGSLANRLLREGLLTQEMLRQLESEWQHQHRNGRYGLGSKRDDQNSSKEMGKKKK